MSSQQRPAEERIKSILEELSKDEQKLLAKVLEIEQSKLHVSTPRINDDILQAVKDMIQ